MNTSSQRREKIWRVRAYYFSFVVSLLVFGALCVAFVRMLTAQGYNVWQWNIDPYFIGMIFWGLAIQIAVSVCRRMGISLDGRSVEIVKRSSFVSTETEQLEPIEFSRGCIGFIIPFCTTILTFIFLDYLFECLCLLNTLIHVPLIALTGATAILSWKNINKPEVRADHAGVSACNIFGIFKSAKWEEIDSCDFVVVRDVFGKITHQYQVIKNNHGKTLLRLEITSQQTEQAKEARNRLTDFIYFKLTGHPKHTSIVNAAD